MKKEKKPVVIMYDSGLDQLERKTIEIAMNEVIDYFPERGFVLSGTKAWGDDSLSIDADQLLLRAKYAEINGKYTVLANSLLSLLTESEWYKKNHFIVVLVVSESLAETEIAPSLRWGSVSVQSVADFRIFQRKERILAIKGLFQHELGHILGIAQDLNRPKVKYKDGIHCTHSGCIMQYFGSIEELIRISYESEHTGRYCPLCAREAIESDL